MQEMTNTTIKQLDDKMVKALIEKLQQETDQAVEKKQLKQEPINNVEQE